MLTKRFVSAENREKEFTFEKKSEKLHSSEKNSKGGRYFCKHFFGLVRDSNPRTPGS